MSHYMMLSHIHVIFTIFYASWQASNPLVMVQAYRLLAHEMYNLGTYEKVVILLLFKHFFMINLHLVIIIHNFILHAPLASLKIINSVTSSFQPH